MNGACGSLGPRTPGSESCATSNALASCVPERCGKIIHAGRWLGWGPGSGAEPVAVVSGSDRRGQGDHERSASGCALARFGVRRAGSRSGIGTCVSGGGATGSVDGDATSGEAVCCADSSDMAAAGRGLARCTSGCSTNSSPGTSRTGALDWASAVDLFPFLGRAFGGCRCHTRAVTKISSFSANGAIRHQVRGSATYRSCELTSSGNRLLSMTGLVHSQVSTPGGST